MSRSYIRSAATALACPMLWVAPALLLLFGCTGKPLPADPKVACRSPNNPDKPPVMMTQWKFDAVRDALLAVVPTDDAGVKVRQLPEMVSSNLRKTLNDAQRERLGSLHWAIDTVRLEMQVRGELESVQHSKPKRVRRAQS